MQENFICAIESENPKQCFGFSMRLFPLHCHGHIICSVSTIRACMRDWAIAFHEGTVKHIYFVAETKGSMSSMQLRMIESSKIHCAREHFRAISNGDVVYDVVDSYQALLDKVMK